MSRVLDLLYRDPPVAYIAGVFVGATAQALRHRWLKHSDRKAQS